VSLHSEFTNLKLREPAVADAVKDLEEERGA
jgi:hypothetical protein